MPRTKHTTSARVRLTSAATVRRIADVLGCSQTDAEAALVEVGAANLSATREALAKLPPLERARGEGGTFKKSDDGT